MTTNINREVNKGEELKIYKLAEKVCVSILDTGYRPEFCYAPINTPGNRWIMAGPNWCNFNEFPLDQDGHGTGILSVLLSTSQQMDGGAIPRIMVQKVCGAGARNLQNNWAAGINYSVNYFNAHGLCGVILLASGSWGLAPEVRNAVSYAERNGALIVTIAHNDNVCATRYPGKLSTTLQNILCVGALNHENRRLVCNQTGKGSNFGPEVNAYDIGCGILALGINGEQISVSGTSVAAARVAALALNLWEGQPTATAIDIRREVSLRLWFRPTDVKL